MRFEITWDHLQPEGKHEICHWCGWRGSQACNRRYTVAILSLLSCSIIEEKKRTFDLLYLLEFRHKDIGLSFVDKDNKYINQRSINRFILNRKFL